MFRTTPDWSRMKEEGCRWMTEDGTLLARKGAEDVTPTLCFEYGWKGKCKTFSFRAGWENCGLKQYLCKGKAKEFHIHKIALIFSPGLMGYELVNKPCIL